jgi:UDP-glucose 4-epimerase
MMTEPFRRVLVTGGAGFIGSELVRRLVGQGTSVVAVDNLVNGKRENLSDLPPDTCELKVLDVRDGDRMTNLMRGIDAVFHLACLGVRHSLHSPQENHEVNASGTLTLLKAARSAGVGRFVYVSSSEVYGTARTVPMVEAHPTLPHTVYGASKLAGECYARAFHRSYGFPTVVVRPFNTYGPRCHHEGDSGEVIPRFLLQALAGQPMVVFGDGTQTRDFTHVSDTVRGILLAGHSDRAVGQTINLGSGREITINELSAEIACVVGQDRARVIHDAPRPGDVLRLYADIALARQVLGFAPRVEMRDGLQDLAAWYGGGQKSPAELLEEVVPHNWVGGKTRSEAQHRIRGSARE